MSRDRLFPPPCPRDGHDQTYTQQHVELIGAYLHLSWAVDTAQARHALVLVRGGDADALHHFPSKNHLVEAVLAWRDEQSQARFTEGTSGRSALRSMVDLVEYNQRSAPELAELYATLSAEATSPDYPVHVYLVHRYSWVVGYTRDALQRADETGELRAGVDCTSAARTVVALMDGLQIQWLYDRAAVDMAAETRRYVQSLFTVDL